MNVLDAYERAAARLDDGELIFDTPDGFERAVAMATAVFAVGFGIGAALTLYDALVGPPRNQ